MRNTCAQNEKQKTNKLPRKNSQQKLEKEHKTYTGIITFMCTY